MTVNPAEIPAAVRGHVCNLLHYTIVYRDIIPFSSLYGVRFGKRSRYAGHRSSHGGFRPTLRIFPVCGVWNEWVCVYVTDSYLFGLCVLLFFLLNGVFL